METANYYYYCCCLLAMLPLFFCAWVCLFAVVGGMLCKSDKPSIIIIITVVVGCALLLQNLLALSICSLLLSLVFSPGFLSIAGCGGPALSTSSSPGISSSHFAGGSLEVGYLTVSVSWPSALNCNPCNHAPLPMYLLHGTKNLQEEWIQRWILPRVPDEYPREDN